MIPVRLPNPLPFIIFIWSGSDPQLKVRNLETLTLLWPGSPPDTQSVTYNTSCYNKWRIGAGLHMTAWESRSESSSYFSPKVKTTPCHGTEEDSRVEGDCPSVSYNTPGFPQLLVCLLPQSLPFLLWRCSPLLERSPLVLLPPLGRSLHLDWFLSPKPLVTASMFHLPLPGRPRPGTTLSQLLPARLCLVPVLGTCSCGSLLL